MVGSDSSAIRAARNIAGVDACTVDRLSIGTLAPGGRPGRTVIWSKGAIGKLESAIQKLEIER